MKICASCGVLLSYGPTMILLIRFLIRAYQWTVSPLLSWLGGPGTGCRFHPTCSVYFLEAIERLGVWRGSWLGLKRLARCHPWGGQGEDPVPMEEMSNPENFRGPTPNVQCRVCE